MNKINNKLEDHLFAKIIYIELWFMLNFIENRIGKTY